MKKTGKLGQGKLLFKEDFEGRKIKSINVIAQDSNYKIDLPLIIKNRWTDSKIIQTAILIVISAIAMFVYLKLFPDAIDQVKVGVLIPLTVVTLSGII